jgi:hypothetical protein
MKSFAATAFALTLSTVTLAMEPREIMQKVYDRDDGNNAIMDMDMLLIDSKGDTRQRTVKSWKRDAGTNGKDTETIMFFIEPADVKNTGFLTYDYDNQDKDDDQWLYLPALKKTKRIASSDKSSSFMGTDFTYADMTKRNVDNYAYKLLKEDTVEGNKVWVIESTPSSDKELEETGYKRTIAFIRQDNYVVIRSVSELEKGGKAKYMEIKELKQVDGIWVGTETAMTTKKGKIIEHQTVLKSRNVQFNQPLENDLFTTRRLEQGL